jgi:hypothetical protein
MKPNAARAWRRLPLQERLRCIVVEIGSEPLAQRGADGFDETIAIAQMPGELPIHFAQRALARIAGVERSGRHFESLTLLTGRRGDAASRAARRLVVLGLSAHAGAQNSSTELLIQGHADASVQERSELFDLVGEVTEASKAVSVRLCFDSASSPRAARRSGVFAKPLRAQA